MHGDVRGLNEVMLGWTKCPAAARLRTAHIVWAAKYASTTILAKKTVVSAYFAAHTLRVLCALLS